MNHPNAAIEVDHLSCTFGRGEALDDIVLTVPRGCLFGLVGLNGSGKTTLIRHIIGGLRPQVGTVRTLGEDPTAAPERLMQRVGYLAEEDALPRWMTVGELVDFLRALYTHWDDTLCGELIDAFGLDRGQKLADLSKGGRARAGLLAAIAHRPELLILDEPSYGLDPIARQDILEAVVRAAADEGRTVLFSSHLLDEVARVCDRVGVIHHGRLLETVAVDELGNRYWEVVCTAAVDESPPPAMEGWFGFQNRGREWSFAVDRSLHPDEGAVRQRIGYASIRELRPITLERWFAARVSTVRSPGSDHDSAATTRTGGDGQLLGPAGEVARR